MSDERHVELLMGRKVRDLEGRVVGRIEEIVAEERDGGWEVSEYHIGTGALLERLGLTLLSFFGRAAQSRGFRVTWKQLDLADAKRPTLTCEKAELRQL